MEERAPSTSSSKEYQPLIPPPAFHGGLSGRHIKTIQQVLMVLIDGLMLFTAFALGYWARGNFPFLGTPINPPPLRDYYPMMAIHVGSLLIFFYLARMYHLRRAISRFDVGYLIAQNISIGTLLAVAVETLALKNSTFDLDYPRGVILYTWGFSIVFIIAGREIHRQLTVRLRKSGVWRDRMIVVGEGNTAVIITNRITRMPEAGYKIVGLVTKDGQPSHIPQGFLETIPLLGKIDDLPTLIDAYQVQSVIVALPDATSVELLHIVTLCQRGSVDIKIYPDAFAFMTSGLTVDEIGGMPLLGVRDIALRGWKLSLKRGLDIVGAAFGLVFLSPFFLFVGGLIYLSDRGTVFFTQERVGVDGKAFPMVKFRTMRVDAEKHGRWTVKNDPRVTKIGAFLRKTNLDELPNLINVLYGQMSLVGPRPEQKKFVEEFREKIPRYMERHREKAGMTGWAQVNGLRGDTSIEERLKYDLYYVENWSLWFDIKIILRTVIQTLTFRNKNAY
jgi:exopolysaccharide biosynthesis polyprenyl glycosylphosphotransferase